MTSPLRFFRSARPLPLGLLAMLLAALPACSGAGQGPAPPEPAGPRVTIPVGPADARPLVTERSDPKPAQPEREGVPWDLSSESIGRQDELEITIQTPRFMPRSTVGSQAEAAKALNRAMAAKAEQWLAEFSKHLVDSRQNIGQGLPAFSLHIKCGSTLVTPRLVSIVCHRHSYTGGVHGNYWFFGHNFGIRDGAVTALELNDLFRQPQQARAALSRTCVADLKRQGAESVVDGSLADVGHMLDAWAIEGAGLRIFFAPYQVAPYADGAFTVLVPMAELRGLVPSHSPLEPLVRAAGKPTKRGR